MTEKYVKLVWEAAVILIAGLLGNLLFWFIQNSLIKEPSLGYLILFIILVLFCLGITSFALYKFKRSSQK